MAEYDSKVLTGEQLGVFSGLVKTAINEKQDELVFNTAYNSSSNKVATMADIPAPYSLPTASTSVLGGVKVDGTTITITDGVISTHFDDINIESEHENQNTGITSLISISINPYEIGLEHYSDVETGIPDDTGSLSYNRFQIDHNDTENAFLESSISIQSNGISFTIQEDQSSEPVEKTLSMNTDGELEWDGEPLGGGASYTAGDGIEIDSNNVISKIIGETPLFVLLSCMLVEQTTTNFTTMTNGVGKTLSRTQTNRHISNLKNYGFTLTSNGIDSSSFSNIVAGFGDNSSAYINYVGFSSDDTANYNINLGVIGQQISTIPSSSSKTLIVFNPQRSEVESGRWYIIPQPWRLFQNIYFNSQQGLTSHSIAAAIDEVVSKVNVKFTAPTAPSTDGSYKLTSTITSGTAAYAWTADTLAYTLPTASTSTLGGVKVDGTTITITDGVISAATSGGGGGRSVLSINTSSLSTADNDALKEIVDWVCLHPEKAAKASSFNTSDSLGYAVDETPYDIYIDGIKPIVIEVIRNYTSNGDYYTYAMNFKYLYHSTNKVSNFAWGRTKTASWTYVTSGSYPTSMSVNQNNSASNHVNISNSSVDAGKLANSAFELQNSTWQQVFQYIYDNYARKVELPTGLPAVPDTDGTYLLKCVMSSGTPTYSWVAET